MTTLGSAHRLQRLYRLQTLTIPRQRDSLNVSRRSKTLIRACHSAPNLKRPQVQWLHDSINDRDGNILRYFNPGLDQRVFVEACDLNDNVVWKSSEWACAEIYQNFKYHYKEV